MCNIKCELLIPLISYIHTSKIMWFHQEKKNNNNKITYK